jgi:hypothetical protein
LYGCCEKSMTDPPGGTDLEVFSNDHKFFRIMETTYHV